MRTKKLLIALLVLVFTFATAITTVFAFANETNVSEQYQTYFDADGNFTGINVKTDASKGITLGVKKTATASAGKFMQVTLDFAGTISPADSTGFFIKMACPNSALSFKFLMKDTDGGWWRACNANTRDDIFVSDDGTIGTLPMKQQQHLFVASGIGTWYIPWSVVLPLTGEGTFAEKSIDSFSFFFTLNANTSNVLWYAGRGVKIASMGTVTVSGANQASANILLDATNLSYTTDSTNNTADVNLSDVTKGKVLRIDGAWDGASNFYNVSSTEGSAAVAAGEITLAPKQLKIKYVDDKGETIQAETSQDVAFDMTTSKFAYNITPPAIAGYDYVSADKALSGEVGADNVITLTYKSNAFVFDWDENPEHYDVTFDADGNVTSLNVKSDMADAFYMGLKKDMTEIDVVFSEMTLDFGEGIDTSKSLGLFIKMEGARPKYGFNFVIVDENGNGYMAFPNCVGLDMFTTEDGAVSSLTEKATQHMFAAGAGTWYIPWSYFEGMNDGETLVAGTVIKTAGLGMVNTKQGWYGGYGIKIASAGTLMSDGENTLLETLIDAKNFVYSSDASDTTADMNMADVTKGKTAYCRAALKNETNGWTFYTGDDETAVGAIANVELMPPSVEIAVRYVDADGDDIRDAETLKFAKASTYTITPANVMGYEYKSADKELTGIASGAMEIVLTYDLVEYTITIKFVDADGEEIATAKTVKFKYKEIYSVTADEIKGYTFVESSRKLSGTMMSDMTITCTYSKNSGCGSSVDAQTGVFFAVIILLGATLVLKKKIKG